MAMTPDMKRLCDAITEIDIGGALKEVPIDDQYDALMLGPSGAEAIVRAVLMAIREPSRTMRQAASRVEIEGDYPSSFTLQESEAAEVLTAMIDHILDEPATA